MQMIIRQHLLFVHMRCQETVMSYVTHMTKKNLKMKLRHSWCQYHIQL